MNRATWTAIEACSESWDPDQQGSSTRPNGQIAYPLLPVPITPTPGGDPRRRYLFRLATLAVDAKEIAILRHVRQAVVIGSIPGPQADPAAAFAPLGFTVRDPFWHFVDGNVTFALRFLPGAPDDSNAAPPPQTEEGVVPTFYGEGSALLVSPTLARGYVADFLPGPTVVPYVPPNGGQPDGADVGDLGYLEDLRYPWTHAPGDDALAPALRGPGTLVLYASVLQTDPRSRPAPVFSDVRALRREDQFVVGVPNVIYRKIGGAFLVDLVDLACAPELLDLALGGKIPARFLALGSVLSPSPRTTGDPPPSGTSP